MSCIDNLQVVCWENATSCPQFF